ncbi:TetR/AcrR family transcriptional regulator [Actinoplanes bogorensis]|uniref:TetR/AcrR family transcriptional regulator n=1 Tax=Paractinoplanes bogorensis TaxID=1610840 RepID=A0ABS5YRT0_9ACTN|nr:TetR/AcrR family transcriptional regulator [Actinoplanes bogorensis]MBU2666149.1 TetR/AcrR family transcriptional regulator [Actinoplanes bogorensis]
MSTAETTGPRERYRAQVQAEIKQHAWEQLAADGVAALSLKAIAKRMGMSGPALYRYYASRDELITALIRDAYRSLADTVRAAHQSGADLGGLAHAVREWALEDPQRYLLIYGTPVPGYHAPADTTAISNEVMTVLIAASRRAANSGRPIEAHLAQHRHWADDRSAPAAALRQALAFWTRVHGVLSLELAGHFAGMGFDPAQLFDDEVATLTRG